MHVVAVGGLRPVTSKKQALRLIQKSGTTVTLSASREILVTEPQAMPVEEAEKETKTTLLVPTSDAPQWGATMELNVTGAHKHIFVRLVAKSCSYLLRSCFYLFLFVHFL
jgi:hypothetical protein